MNRQSAELETRYWPVGSQQVDQAHILKRVANGHVDSPPRIADAANLLVVAMAVSGAALGD